MPKGGRIKWTDAQLLRMLDLREQGLSAAAIGREMNARRNQVIGALWRIDEETALHDLTPERNGVTDDAPLFFVGAAE